MIELIFKGIVIGLFISVPLGPIGMLCVQRTLSRGRKFGIITGLGATASDLLYTIIALFFIGFVVDTLEDNQLFIQVTGSIIVIVFGLFIFKNNPSTQPLPVANEDSPLLKDFFSSFILTLTNPLILFILIALFARFEFLDENTTPLLNITGIISILSGAFLWWSTLTWAVSKFRNRLTYSGLKRLNRITGIVIMAIGLAGIMYNIIYWIYF